IPAKDAHQGWAIGNTYAFIDAKNQRVLEKAFHSLFGQALAKKTTGALTRYDGKAVEAAFAALYLPPSTMAGGMRASAIYDTLFKSFVAQKAEVIATVLDRKGFLVRKAKELETAARDPKLDGLGWQYKMVEELAGPLQNESRLIGTLVRRQADGSLP